MAKGTASRDDRFFIANALKKMARAPCPKMSTARANPNPFHGKSNTSAETRHQDRRRPNDRSGHTTQARRA